jgi:hypothetical protein
MELVDKMLLTKQMVTGENNQGHSIKSEVLGYILIN